MSSMDVMAWNCAGLYPAVAASGCSPQTVCERCERRSWTSPIAAPAAAEAPAEAAEAGSGAGWAALSTATAEGSTWGSASKVTVALLLPFSSATCTDDLERLSRMIGSAAAPGSAGAAARVRGGVPAACSAQSALVTRGEAPPDARGDALPRASGLSGGVAGTQSCTVVASALPCVVLTPARAPVASPAALAAHRCWCCASCSCSLKKSPESKYLCWGEGEKKVSWVCMSAMQMECVGRELWTNAGAARLGGCAGSESAVSLVRGVHGSLLFRLWVLTHGVAVVVWCADRGKGVV